MSMYHRDLPLQTMPERKNTKYRKVLSYIKEITSTLTARQVPHPTMRISFDFANQSGLRALKSPTVCLLSYRSDSSDLSHV